MVSRFTSIAFRIFVTLPVVVLAIDCRRSVPAPAEEQPSANPSTTAKAIVGGIDAAALNSVKPAASSVSDPSSNPPVPVASTQSVVAPTGGDPLQGKFTMADATKGLKPKGKLWAEIVTDKGKLGCELFDDKAPVAVANFVGLARGLRPFKDPKTAEWVKRPAYDGTGFHRIIKGFMIQGGDPAGTGAGEPGYVFADEVWTGATHDRRGLICMANKGPNTNGMQFFILDGEAKHLDRSFTIFGSCSPDAVLEKLANSEVQGDRAINPPKITKVTILRK